jgi:hypothetical protein
LLEAAPALDEIRRELAAEARSALVDGGDRAVEHGSPQRNADAATAVVSCARGCGRAAARGRRGS